MKTSILAATVSSLALAKATGLLLSFNFGKLHIQGQAQEVSVTTDGAAIKGDLYQVDTTVDFDTINLATLQRTVLDSLNSAVVLTVTDDRELLVSHMFKSVCSSQALKALKTTKEQIEAEAALKAAAEVLMIASGDKESIEFETAKEAYRLAKAAKEEADSVKTELDLLNRADTFVNALLPRILCSEPVQRTKLSTGEVFNFKHFGLDAAMFATGNKSTYNMPNNGGIKVYLKEEFEAEFFRLKKAGLLMSKMFTFQEDGDFTGCYAVLIPAKA